jgi:heptosyltransferase-3
MNPRRILFIAPTRIGDAVLATAILRHLLTIEPAARVTIITSPLAAPLYEGYPALERIIPVTKKRYHAHWLALWRATIGTHWDAVWDMRNSILSYTLRASQRHSYKAPAITAPKVTQYAHAFGTGALPYPTLWAKAENHEKAHSLLPDAGRYLILAPIANWAPKEWPMGHFITLALDLLGNACKGFRPVVICAGHEREKALPLLTALSEYHPIDLTSGEAHLLTVFAAMQRAHGFIGNDSGLMHMAAAAGIPTLGLFGPTPHELYQPWGEKSAYVAAGGGDLSTLSPTTVAQEFAALLQRAP